MQPCTDEPEIHSVILAAGAARRFGTPKQLARLHGETLLQRALATATAVTPQRTLLVVGAHAAPVLAAIPAAACVVSYNPRWASGQGSSIACAARALPDRCAAMLLWHVDQPLLDATALAALVTAWQRTPTHIVAARYAGTVGAPVVLPRRVFAALRQLAGERGAKPLIRGDDRTLTIDLPQAATDVDTPAALAALAGD